MDLIQATKHESSYQLDSRLATKSRSEEARTYIYIRMMILEDCPEQEFGF